MPKHLMKKKAAKCNSNNEAAQFIHTLDFAEIHKKFTSATSSQQLQPATSVLGDVQVQGPAYRASLTQEEGG